MRRLPQRSFLSEAPLQLPCLTQYQAGDWGEFAESWQSLLHGASLGDNQDFGFCLRDRLGLYNQCNFVKYVRMVDYLQTLTATLHPI